MPVTVTRKEVLFNPDVSRVIARFLFTSAERSLELIERIIQLPAKKQQETLTQVLRDYSKRHRSISRIFEKHFNRLSPLFNRISVNPYNLTSSQKVLIGSYFTMEYSIEAAAFFNPSIVADPDQSGLGPGQKRVIISFRATEREGYVPNVVYSCGSMVHGETLVLPYAMSDRSSTYATVNLAELLAALKQSGQRKLN